MSQTFGQGRGFTVFPPFIKFLLIANVAIYLVQSVFLMGLSFGGRPLDASVMSWFALWPIENGFLPWQLITYQFMHGSLGHLFFNMLALFSLKPLGYAQVCDVLSLGRRCSRSDSHRH